MTRECQKLATKKWNKKNYDSITIRLPKGSRERMKEWAAQEGLSLAAFIRTAAEEKAERRTRA